MYYLVHEELNRARVEHQLSVAQRQRRASYLVRLTRARRAERRARRRVERAQAGLRTLNG
ncbi:MAG: hypothetical protein ACRC35_00450 [Angustibacter sp.]